MSDTSPQDSPQQPATPAMQPSTPPLASTPDPKEVWFRAIRSADRESIKRQLDTQITALAKNYDSYLQEYLLLSLYDPDGAINRFHLNQIYRVLRKENAKKARNVFLFLGSGGGSIGAAYQISKICREMTRKDFVVVIPREAKSAATLLALGADRIHLGPLAELGPIDPQIGRLPMLGVSQALQLIAGLAQSYPGSAEMFARYLQLALTVEQIGYCERSGESAVQYAERLLSSKPDLPKPAKDLAHFLVYAYKDHGFVIDRPEAETLLGSSWIIADSPEIQFAEELFEHLETAQLLFDVLSPKPLKLNVIGAMNDGSFIWQPTDPT